jgi:hypothetical protein
VWNCPEETEGVWLRPLAVNEPLLVGVLKVCGRPVLDLVGYVVLFKHAIVMAHVCEFRVGRVTALAVWLLVMARLLVPEYPLILDRAEGADFRVAEGEAPTRVNMFDIRLPLADLVGTLARVLAIPRLPTASTSTRMVLDLEGSVAVRLRPV